MLWFLVVVGDFLFLARPSTDRMDGRVRDTGASIDDVICCDVGATSLVCFCWGGKVEKLLVASLSVVSGSELHLACVCDR